MITTAYLFRYRIKEFIQFMRNALMITNQHGPSPLRVKAQYQALNKCYQQLESSYQQNTDNSLSQELVQLDTARDQAIVCLRMLSEGYTRHPGKAQREAGQRVLEGIDKYGSRLYDLNYGAETAALKKVVNDMQSDPTGAAAIRQLHLEAVVAEIKRTNQEFERQFVRHLEATSQSDGPRMRELVQQTADAYRTMVDHLQAHALLTPSTEYTLFGHHFNENVEHYNQIVDRRKQTAEASADAEIGASREDTEELISE